MISETLQDYAPCLSFYGAKKLINTLVFSHIDYWNALLAGVSKSTLNKLQYMQNSAARIGQVTTSHLQYIGVLGLAPCQVLCKILQGFAWFGAMVWTFNPLHSEVGSPLPVFYLFLQLAYALWVTGPFFLLWD